jgi:tetratricopeptide (TPR) repeat protein
LNWLREHLDGAKLSLIILDACRTLANVPAKGPNDGLAPLYARGSLIAYAADEGQSASDNDSEDLSLFTKHLIAELNKRDESLCQLFAGVRAAVVEASSHVQFPFVYDGVIGEFVFNRASTGESQQLTKVFATQGSTMAWTTIQYSDNPNDFAAFLGRDPQDNSQVKVASDRLSTLMAVTAKAVAVVPVSAQEPPHIIAIANQGERLFYERAYAPALESYKQLLQLRPSEVAVLYDYATCLLHLGRNDDAIHFFTKALEVDPAFPWAYYNRGVAQHLKGSFTAAIEDYNQALKLRPNYALAYNNLALAKRQSGDIKGADTDVAKAISLDSHYAPSYFNRAEILKDNGDKSAAAQYIDKGKVLTLPSQSQ